MYKFALIGGRLGHSYSPLIHSKFGDYEYELCEVEPDDLETLLRSGLYDGFNVTIPYKQKVMEFCAVSYTHLTLPTICAGGSEVSIPLSGMTAAG